MRARFIFLIFIFCTSRSVVSAAENQECAIKEKNITPIKSLWNNAKITTEKSLDAESGENLITQKIYLSGERILTVRQKYCEMYNFTATFQLNKLDEKSFYSAVEEIEKASKAVNQDYKTNAPLSEVVRFALAKSGTSMKSDFMLGIDAAAAESNLNLEHHIKLTRLNHSQAGQAAEVEFYFGLGASGE
jgi:hypothetical protein